MIAPTVTGKGHSATKPEPIITGDRLIYYYKGMLTLIAPAHCSTKPQSSASTRSPTNAGENPGTTGGKVNALRGIAASERDSQGLMRNWQSADKLHIHADRGNLNASEYADAWEQTQAFIESMLTIYAREA